MKIKVNRNRAKWLMLPVPLIVLWLTFFVAHLTDMNVDSWWGIPYLITSLFCIIFSAIMTVKVIDNDYY